MRAAGRRSARRRIRLTLTPDTGAAIGWCECATLLRRCRSIMLWPGHRPVGTVRFIGRLLHPLALPFLPQLPGPPAQQPGPAAGLRAELPGAVRAGRAATAAASEVIRPAAPAAATARCPAAAGRPEPWSRAARAASEIRRPTS